MMYIFQKPKMSEKYYNKKCLNCKYCRPYIMWKTFSDERLRIILKRPLKPLYARCGPGPNYDVIGVCQTIDTVVEVRNGWGRLESGVGWIDMGYVELADADGMYINKNEINSYRSDICTYYYKDKCMQRSIGYKIGQLVGYGCMFLFYGVIVYGAFQILKWLVNLL